MPALITQQPASAFVAKGSSANLSVSVAAGVTPTYQWYRGNSPNTSDPITGATSSTFTSPALNASINYWVKVTRSGTVANSNTAVITVGSPPAVTTQPAAASTISSGATATLTVAASGDGLTYQWFQGAAGDTTTPVTGATSPSFTTPALTASTSYWVRATNSFGTANSQTAAVTVTVPAPQITAQPQAATITSGSTATLSVTATGTSPAYQWYQGDSGVTTTPVTGATSASFTTPVLTANTSYWVRVSNAGGQVDSSAALVTVTPADPVVQWKAGVFSQAQLADPEISGDAADPDGDGIKNSDEYLFGTSPLASDKALLGASAAGGQVSVTFIAKLATGTGYSGKTRHYALQSAADLSGSWTPVASFEDITGNDQVETFTAAPSTARQFFRLSVTLTP